MQDVINEIISEFKNKVDEHTNILLDIAKCKNRKDARSIQISLVENGLDLVQYNFQSNSLKRLIALTTIKNKFKKGYLIEFNMKTNKIEVIKVNGKKQFEKIIKDN